MNPDVIPLYLGIPLAIALWGWLGVVIAADRRARRSEAPNLENRSQ